MRGVITALFMALAYSLGAITGGALAYQERKQMRETASKVTDQYWLVKKAFK